MTASAPRWPTSNGCAVDDLEARIRELELELYRLRSQQLEAKAPTIVEVLTHANQPLTSREIAQRTGLGPTRVCRRLAAMPEARRIGRASGTLWTLRSAP